MSGNSQLEKDYVWTCTYTKQNTGCCQRGDSCTDESSQAACSGEGAIWHKGACCEDVAACGGSGGCCKYTDGTCAGGVTHKACTAAANSQEWSVGACPPAPDCIPEPATVLLVMSGFGAAGFYLRRRRARR